MIVVYHQNNRVVEVNKDGQNIACLQVNIIRVLFEIASLNANDLIVWCNIDFKLNLNFSKLKDIFHHRKIMASYNVYQNSFLSDAIGYAEESPFIKINKNVSYPSWQMSGCVGGIYAEVLLAFKEEFGESKSFDYFLHSMAKLAMPNGLLCYSNPELLKDLSNLSKKHKQNNFTLFKFVKQHYKTRWVFLLFLNLFLYERKIVILPLLRSLFYGKKKLKDDLLDNIQVQSTKKVVDLRSIDVIIPTIGRKQYLFDVLKDLSKQTHLPKNVIIVEQNPNPDSLSELDYITIENWPFIIKHIFIHQAGACNARNLALAEVENEWVFLNDDDNRFEADLLEKTLVNLEQFGSKVAGNSYLKINETKVSNYVFQSPIFGSGNSFIASSLLEKVIFKMGFEFGYGEDSDFGMQLRNCGADVLYFPEPNITHLSAQMGGFRTKPILAWQSELIQPKPSPTVMLNKLSNLSKQQINGYKTILFLKFYKVQSIKNPIFYFFNFIKQWEKSLYWANELKKR